MIHFFSIISIFFSVFFFGNNVHQEQIENHMSACERSYPEVDTTNTKITVNQLKAITKHTDYILVEGYVTYKYKCPPCPLGRQCKPCAAPYIYIDKEASLKTNTLQTMVHVDKTCQFKKNKKYIFAIERTVREFENTDGKKRYAYKNRLKAYTLTK